MKCICLSGVICTLGRLPKRDKGWVLSSFSETPVWIWLQWSNWFLFFSFFWNVLANFQAGWRDCTVFICTIPALPNSSRKKTRQSILSFKYQLENYNESQYPLKLKKKKKAKYLMRKEKLPNLLSCRILQGWMTKRINVVLLTNLPLMWILISSSLEITSIAGIIIEKGLYFRHV